ncbi:MAG: PAS-domain containing protein [Rhizobiales bacterium]|nr:PAS-domain containing protein [Hyphomicrobiales bacterium]
MVFQAWTIVLVGFCYVGLLFAVATWGDRLAARRKNQRRPRPLIYALSLGVYCTSWTYFGSVGISSRTGYDFIPVYLGPILVFALAYPLISRIVMIAKTQNIASIADFISARYGKNEALGALVAMIAVIGIVPYISIQLKALSFSLQTVIASGGATGSAAAGSGWAPLPLAGDIALFVTIAMAIFAILFGTRHIDTTEHQDGMILAVAVESVVKLVAFVAVGVFVTYALAGGVGNLFEIVRSDPRITAVFDHTPDGGRWLSVTLVSAIAVLLLPRQFHVAVVENAHGSDVRRAAWLFPLYLVLINLFVAPIAIVGLQMQSGADPDTYVLALPVLAQSPFFTTVAFVGGVSAATAMVIVETIALAIMVSNNIVVPLVLLRQGEHNMFQHREGDTRNTALINIRRISICCILLFAYLYYWLAGNAAALAQTGLISFAAIAQFAPSFFGGLYWRNGTARGAAAGIFAGFAVWAYTLLIPSFIDSGWLGASLLQDGPFGIAALKPRQLLGIEFDPLTHGVLWSLLANIAAYAAVSAMRPPSRIEALQAEAFLPDSRAGSGLAGFRLWRSSVTVAQVEETVARYLGTEKTREAFAGMVAMRGLANDPGLEADIGILNFGEHLLASAIGPASSRLVMALLLERHTKGSRDAMQLLDDASSAIEHNRSVLQSAIDNVPQGIAVFDHKGALVSWNAAVKDVLALPVALLRVGTRIDEFLIYVGTRTLEPEARQDSAIAARRRKLFAGEGQWRQRLVEPLCVVDIHSGRLPDGGIVVSFSDVTETVAAADSLLLANETLELRVAERTAELTKLNGELAKAKAEADAANQGKTRFFAAASHDILQPLNAARLFTSTLVEGQAATPDKTIVRNVDAALEAVEDILSTVLDISRLDAGAIKPEVESFPVQELFDTLAREFDRLASDKHLSLRFVHTTAVVKSDRKLLRRVLQNLVSNAIKYTPKGRVLVGVRRKGSGFQIAVHDTGLGIPSEQLRVVFREFERLGRDKHNEPGLGLGLSIVDRLCKVLRHPITLTSQVNTGSAFMVLVPGGREAVAREAAAVAPPVIHQPLAGLRVLAVDNETSIVEGLSALLANWNVTVIPATSAAEAVEQMERHGAEIDAVLADYHIHREDGIALVQALRRRAKRHIPAILITADRSKRVQDDAQAASIHYLRKPVKPASLRASLSQIALSREAAE